MYRTLLWILWKKRSLIIMLVQQLQRFVWRNLNILDRSGSAASADIPGRPTLMERAIATQVKSSRSAGVLAIGENVATAPNEIRTHQMPCKTDGVHYMVAMSRTSSLKATQPKVVELVWVAPRYWNPERRNAGPAPAAKNKSHSKTSNPSAQMRSIAA